jgi:dTDP-L-rhamnose 4-epimerase
VSHVLVTGGAGFVGSFVVDALVARGDDVRVVDCLHPAAHRQRPDYLNPGAEYLWGDLRDPEVACRATAGVAAVCHQASMVGLGVDFADVTGYVAHNDGATAELLHALHDRDFTGRFVLASSMVVYGDGRYRCARHGAVAPDARRLDDLERGFWDPRCPECGAALAPETVTEDAPTSPRNVYAATKLHQEHLTAAYAREHASPFVALRYHNVYGPRMPRDTPYAGVASIFRSALQRGDAPAVFEDGRQRRDFVHVSDVAAANLLALSADADVCGPFNVATGAPCTLYEMACDLAGAFGSAAPAPAVVGGYRLGDVRHVFGGTERARRLLGYTAAVERREGLADFARQALRP